MNDVQPDGSLVLDQPVKLPDVLDVLIVGGGPLGTSAAFRAKELGLKALVIELDDLLKRIRDYAKDKLIKPNYGGGDRMEFPKGDALIAALQFDDIDKDDMCARWKGLYRKFSVPAQVGVELTGMVRQGNAWRVQAWNHNTQKEQAYLAKHVVIGFGRGVPRRLDVTGDLAGMAFNLTDPAKFVGSPACVVGGGTSAAEAVIAISNAKAQADDPSAVYWSYRGDKLPKVSKALAEVFFDAFMGNGNIRYLAKSEPVAVIGAGGTAMLSVRTSRMEQPGEPPSTTQLEFQKLSCIACIGEEIPEPLLNSLGVPLVSPDGGKKRTVVTQGLESRQPDVYLTGALLSPIYLETSDFDGDPSQFKQVDRVDNIKSAMRDGVLVAQVISQKLAGRQQIDIVLDFEETPPSMPPDQPALDSGLFSKSCVLVSVLQSGVEANQYRLKRQGTTTIGRAGTDILFPEDLSLSDQHAELVRTSEGYRIGATGAGSSVYLQLGGERAVPIEGRTIMKAGEQWFVVGGADSGALLRYDGAGKQTGRYDLKDGTTVVGRDSPDLTVAPDDRTLSRRHFSVSRKDGRLTVKDLGSANGTLIKISTPVLLVNGDRVRLGQQMLKFSDDRVSNRPPDVVTFHTMPSMPPSPGPVGPVPPPPVPPRPPEPQPPPGPKVPPVVPPTPAGDPGAPSVLLKSPGGPDRLIPCKKGETILEAAERAGVKIDWECKVGRCGIDPIKVLSGAEFLNQIKDPEDDTLEAVCKFRPIGPHRLACVARVSGPVVIELVKASKR
jgi:thioredoxin reductase/ferredoxin